MSVEVHYLHVYTFNKLKISCKFFVRSTTGNERDDEGERNREGE